MPALLKYFVLLTLFLLESHANVLTSVSLVAGDQVWVIHLIQLQQPMSNPTNEPSCKSMSIPTNELSSEPIHELNGINASYTFEAVNGVNADASYPALAKTSEGDKTSYTFGQ